MWHLKCHNRGKGLCIQTFSLHLSSICTNTDLGEAASDKLMALPGLFSMVMTELALQSLHLHLAESAG